MTEAPIYRGFPGWSRASGSVLHRVPGDDGGPDLSAFPRLKPGLRLCFAPST